MVKYRKSKLAEEIMPRKKKIVTEQFIALKKGKGRSEQRQVMLYRFYVYPSLKKE